MCGVVAIFSDQGGLSQDSLDRALASLHHRGPDGQGCWLSPDRRVALGHTRLSIIDLSGGSQPIANEDDSVRIVANGEFYDFERQQRALEQAGHTLRSRSDSEIALHLYEDLGLDCVHQLRGEFAFAIWDEKQQRLVAVRDRYGIKPLFYSRHKGAVYLASEIKALFAAGIPARWDPESVLLGLALRDTHRTAFQGVYQLPPGHHLVADSKGVAVTQYWDVTYPPADAMPPDLTEAEFVRQFRSSFEESVRLRLRADVPVACYLSGGLDSCAILGMAARHRSNPIHAFTVCFDDEGYDEGTIAKEMAESAGAEFVPLAFGEEVLADNFADAVFYSENICFNPHGVAKYLLSKAVRDAGFKVVLTGEGADEVMAGYPHFRSDLLHQKSTGADPEETDQLLARLYEENEVSAGSLLPRRRVEASPMMSEQLGAVPTWLMPHLARFEDLRLIYSAAFFSTLRLRDPAERLLGRLDVDGRLAGRDPVHQALYLWAKTMLPNYILVTLGDRMEMAHSVEGRLPFLDQELTALLERVPLDLKIRGLTEKYILREATRDLVTGTVYRRQKHPFLAPPATLGAGRRFFQLIQDTLRSKAMEAVPFLEAVQIRQVADAVLRCSPEQLRAADGKLLSLVSTIILHERLGVEG